jgi:transposase-like protein
MENFICPKCKSPNAYRVEDKGDDLGDLCFVCPDCGYDERETKKLLNSSN